MTQHPHYPPKHPWLVPGLLIALSLLPVAASAYRLNWLMGDRNAPHAHILRFDGEYVALAIHILCGSAFLLIAALQFAPTLRARYRKLHRTLGRVALVAAVLTGISTICLLLAYPPGPLATPFSDMLRTGLGLALAIYALSAARAIRAGDIARHRAWVIRATALAIASTTQAFFMFLWQGFIGPLEPVSNSALVALSFAVNIAWAEWRITLPRRTATGSMS